MKGRIVLIFIIVTILTNSCLLSVVSQNNQIDNLQYSSKPSGLIPKFFFRVLVHGNASSGRQLGVFGNIGIIKFNYVQFVLIRFFPIRLDVTTERNVTAFIYGIGQEIPNGSFNFEEEWILFALVF